MEIINVRIKDLKCYKKNAKLHTDEQINHIANSIKSFGMNDPIAIATNKNIIVTGHGRYLACKQLGMEEAPCIRLEHLTENERKAYMLVHNQTTLETGFNIELLEQELADLVEFDLIDFGFDVDIDDETFTTQEKEKKSIYTDKIKIPLYEITKEKPELYNLYKNEKSQELIQKIQNSKVTQEEKEFLYEASKRHIVFDYGKIAEYYSHSDKEMQQLMEDSALVIIDYNKALENGFVKLDKTMDVLCDANE